MPGATPRERTDGEPCREVHGVPHIPHTEAPRARGPRRRSQPSMSGFSARLTKFAKTHAGENVIARYCRGEIDAVYILFNEFKSVIAQRLVAERLMSIKEIGEVDIQMAEEASLEERKQRIEAAKTAGVGLRPPRTQLRLTKPPPSSEPGPSITSTSRSPSSFSREFCRNTSASRFFTRYSSPWQPNTPHV